MSKKGSVRSGSLTDRVLDRLTTDGGWMSSSLIYDYFSNNRVNSIQQTLGRLRDKGWVESRLLDESVNYQSENEWRVHLDFEWRAENE